MIYARISITREMLEEGQRWSAIQSLAFPSPNWGRAMELELAGMVEDLGGRPPRLWYDHIHKGPRRMRKPLGQLPKRDRKAVRKTQWNTGDLRG